MNSMTGFGVARGKVGRSHFLVEARSVNHRFCEVSLRFPGRFAGLEPEATRLVRQRFARGKFDLFLRQEAVAREEEELVLARKAHHLLKRIQKELRLPGGITLSDLVAFRDVFASLNPQEDYRALNPGLGRLLNAALSGLENMRRREGGRLQKWFLQKISQLQKLLVSIERSSLNHGKEYRHHLRKKLKGMGTIEEERVLQEAAMKAERSDVIEEIVRLRSHLEEFARLLKEKEPLGRKLDFLAQEMGREINTVGSKSQGVKLAHLVIEFKSQLERIREQVQNIE